MAQIFINEGLTLLLNDVITATPTTVSTLYIGLFTGTIPTATATLASGITEQNGSGYARQAITFQTPSTATIWSAATPAAVGTLNGAVSASYVITVTTYSTGSYAAIKVGMSIDLGTGATGGTTGTSAGSLFVVTALPGSNQIVLNAAATQSTNGSTVKIGDVVSGVKTSPSAAVTFGPATGSWSTATTGYFICTVGSGTSGKLLYAANFADGSTPTLAVNDTLNVTPTWLMSN